MCLEYEQELTEVCGLRSSAQHNTPFICEPTCTSGSPSIDVSVSSDIHNSHQSNTGLM